MELCQNRIPYSSDVTMCHISSILRLTASVIFTLFTIHDAVLSPSLICMYTCWPVILVGNLLFILLGRDQDIL